MRWTTAALVVGVVGVACLSGEVLARRAGPPEGGIGFVDLDRVLNESRAGRSLIARLQEESRILDESVRKRAKDLEQAYGDLKANFAPGTAEFQKGRKDLAQREWEIDFDRKSGLEALFSRQSEEMARMFRDIQAEAARIGESRKLAAVLQYDPSELDVRDRGGKVMGPDEVQFRMAARSVLWRAADVDLTEAVLDAVGRGEPPAAAGGKDKGTGGEPVKEKE